MGSDVRLWGRLAADPIIRVTESGRKWGTFTIASRSAEKTDWIDVKTSKKSVDYVVNFKKGNYVNIKGFLTQDKWKTKEGKMASAIRVVCMEIEAKDFPPAGKEEKEEKEDELPF